MVFLEKKNFFGINLIKTIAIISVVSVHFLLNTDFYKVNIEGNSLFFQVFYRQLFIICVPLFLICTGFLQSQKTYDKKYFKGILDIAIIYILISIFVILLRVFYFGEVKTIFEWVQSVLIFEGIRYAWYIEMYIGLALLIPFINNIHKMFSSKREFQLFLLVLMFVSSVPNFWNVFNSNIDYLKFLELPDYWNIMYPFVYYFIGVYFKKHDIGLNRAIAFALFLLLTVLESVLLIWQNHGEIFVNRIGSYGSILVVLQATFLFKALYQVKEPNNFIKKVTVLIVNNISILTLDIFLFSAITDKVIYDWLKKNILLSQDHIILYSPIIVTVSFVAALILANMRHKMLPLRKHKVKSEK